MEYVYTQISRVAVNMANYELVRVLSDIPANLELTDYKAMDTFYEHDSIPLDIKMPDYFSSISLCNGRMRYHPDMLVGKMLYFFTVFARRCLIDSVDKISVIRDEEHFWHIVWTLAFPPYYVRYPYDYSLHSVDGIQKAFCHGYLSPFGFDYRPDGEGLYFSTEGLYEYGVDTYSKYMFLEGEAFFDCNYRLLRVTHKGEDLDINNVNTIHLLLSTLLTQQVALDHLIFTHYIISNQITTLNIKYLSVENPLRILLGATEHRVLDVNELASLSLFTKIGVCEFLPLTMKGGENLLHKSSEHSFQRDMVRKNILTPFRKKNNKASVIEDAQLWYHIFHDFCESFIDEFVDIDDDEVTAWFDRIKHIHPERKTKRDTIVDIATWCYYINIVHETYSNERLLKILNPYQGVSLCRFHNGDVPIFAKTIEMTIANTTKFDGVSLYVLNKEYLEVIPSKYHAKFDDFVRSLDTYEFKSEVLLPGKIEISVGW